MYRLNQMDIIMAIVLVNFIIILIKIIINFKRLKVIIKNNKNFESNSADFLLSVFTLSSAVIAFIYAMFSGRSFYENFEFSEMTIRIVAAVGGYFLLVRSVKAMRVYIDNTFTSKRKKNSEIVCDDMEE